MPVFTAAVTALSELGIAHLELREPPLAPLLRPLNSDFDGARARADLRAGVGDAIAFGRRFISNPDLPRKLAENLPLTPSDPTTGFSQGAACYIDYLPG